MTTVREIMTPHCECVGEAETLVDAARKMRDLDVGALPICGEDDKLMGMVADRDIVVRCVAEGVDPRQVLVADLAQGIPLYVEAEAPIEAVMKTMAEHQVRRVPVIEDRRLVGIVAQADLVRSQPAAAAGQVVQDVSEDR